MSLERHQKVRELVGGWSAGMDMFHDPFPFVACAGFDGWEAEYHAKTLNPEIFPGLKA